MAIIKNITSGSVNGIVITGSLNVSNGITGSLFGTASWALNTLTSSYVLNAVSSSFASTASFAPNYLPLTGGTINGNVTVNGTASVSFLNVTIQSSSIIYSSGSNIFGDSTQDTQTLIGTVLVSGSQSITGSLNVSQGITGSLLGTASWAINAITASFIISSNVFGPFGSNSILSASYAVSSSQTVTASFASTASYVQLAQSASYVLNAVSSSFASTASYVNNAQTASYVLQAISASYANTASYVENAQTASNILGGKAPHVPFFITDTTLATSSIYQSGSSTVIINQDAATTANPEALYVWQPSTSSFNVISGKGNLDNYLQLNVQNTNQGSNASSDVVATANNGNETTRYVNMGINNENYSGFLGGPNDAYLYSTGEDLLIGNYSDGKNVHFFNSSSANPLITLTPSNTVDVQVALNAPDITGSLEGTASWARNVISASHAVNSDFAGYAQTAGVAANGGVTQIVAGSGVSLIPSTGVGNVTVIATGVGGVTILSGSNVTESFANSAIWAFTHSLGTRTPVISVFDNNYNQVIPESIQLVDTASAIITFPTLESGFAVATVGGITGNALSSSYSLFATYADTASYYVEKDPVFVARSASLATTGSNLFIGTQRVTGSIIVTGSVIVSGSSTFTNIGPAIFTGSLNVSGSTTQTGNNTLIGNTTLSGSINVSGSQTFNGSSSFYGTHELSGSNTIRGNTFMFGNIQVSGSSNFNNSEFIVTGSTSILGDLNVKGTSVFSNTTFTVTGSQYFTGSSFINGNQSLTGNSTVTGSLNVIGDINVVSGSSFTRWGNKLFNYGAFSDYTTQSGSANTAHAITFNTTDVALGVSLSGSSAMKIENTGIYNFQWSGQANEGAGAAIISIWLRVNGNDIPGSRGDISLASNNAALPAWNYVLPFNANDAIELYWSSTSANTTWVYSPPAINPTRPSTASIIATITQIA